MAQVTNSSGVVQRLRDRKGVLHEIAPGETQRVDIDPAKPRIAAKIRAGNIRVETTPAAVKQAPKARPKKAARAKPTPAASSTEE